mgnify:CR=1 FL=1
MGGRGRCGGVGCCARVGHLKGLAPAGELVGPGVLACEDLALQRGIE